MHPGSIIILHPWYPSRRTSRAAIGPLVDSLHARGYRVEAVRTLLEASRVAFANGMGDALIVAAVVAFAGALVSFFFLPARARDPIALETEDELPAGRATEVAG